MFSNEPTNGCSYRELAAHYDQRRNNQLNQSCHESTQTSNHEKGVIPLTRIARSHRFHPNLPASTCVRIAFLFLATSALSLAQTSSFGQAAQGIATEMIAIAKWLGIILCIICGLSLMGGGGHGAGMVGRITGLVIGLVFALFAGPIVSWIQAL